MLLDYCSIFQNKHLAYTENMEGHGRTSHFWGSSEEDSPLEEILHFSILSVDCVRLFHSIEIGEEK